jgi:PAS domain S-box-containing protein
MGGPHAPSAADAPQRHERAGRRDGAEATERQLSEIVEQAADFIGMTDEEGRLIYLNGAGRRMLGLSENEDITVNRIADFHPASAADPINVGLLHAERAGAWHGETVLERKDGSQVPVSQTIVAHRNGQGEIQAFSIIARDLTESSRAVEALWKSEERFRLLVERVKDYAILMLDPEGRIVSWNEGAERIKGYRAEEIIGQSVARFYTPEDIERGHPEDLLKKAEAEGQAEDEGWRVRKDGSRFWADVSVTALRDGLGRLRGFAKVTRDLTERKQAETEINIRARQQAAVALLGQQALGGADADELFGDAVVAVAHTLAVEYSRVAELLPDGALLLRAGVGWKEGMVGKATVPSGVDSQAGYTILSGAPVIVEDLRKEKRFKAPALLVEHGVVSGLSTVIRGRDRPFGVLAVHTTRPRKFTTDDVNFLQAVANVLADAIERKRAEESVRQLSGRLLQLQDEEQQRIARELQASTARIFDPLLSELSAVKESGIVLDWKTSEALQKSLKLAREAAKEVRNVSYLLYPRLLDEAGLVEAIRWYGGGFSQRTGIRTVMDLPSKFGRLSQDAERTLFRVVQESLANVHRHSGSQVAEIRLAKESYAVKLEVKDRGKGIPPRILEESSGTVAMSGVGIRGMFERLRQLGGRLEIDSGARGTNVTAILPASSARGKAATGASETR